MSTEIVEPTIGTSDTSFLTPKDIFNYQPNPIGQAVSNTASQIGDFFSNLFKFGNVSNAVDTGAATPRISSSFNPNLVIGSTAVLGSTALIYATATNPGVQSTTQTVANAIKPLTSATNSVLSTNYGPYIVIGGLLLIGALILKK